MDKHDRAAGVFVPNWTPPRRPGPALIEGHHARLHRLNADAHAAALHQAFGEDDAMWDYMSYGPFPTAAAYDCWICETASSEDPFFYAIEDRATGHHGGVVSFCRISPDAGSIEVGHVALSRSLRLSVAASEAFYLMMAWAFGAGYRRFEWKCNALNMASRRAGERLGLSFEGIFRQACVVKGRNRDTAWSAAIDSEWPALQSAFQAWLAPDNFDSAGRQLTRLSDLTGPLRVAHDPALR